MLLKKIKALPTELLELYRSMWKRLSEDQSEHEQESSFLFNCILRRHERGDDSYLPIMFAYDTSLRQQLLSPGPVPTTLEVLRRCRVFYRQLMAKTGSLLEVKSSVIPYLISGKLQELETYDSTLEEMHVASIIFIHRSAREFLVDTDDGRKICSSDVKSSSERNLLLFLSDLCTGLIKGFRQDPFVPQRSGCFEIDEPINVLQLICDLYRIEGESDAACSVRTAAMKLLSASLRRL
jgi:hypothetical protein